MLYIMSEFRRQLMTQGAETKETYCVYYSMGRYVPIILQKNVLRIEDVETGQVLLEKDPPTGGEIDTLFYWNRGTTVGLSYLKITLWPEAMLLRDLFKHTDILQVDETIFYNCPNITSVSGMFEGTGLTEIPPLLFSKNSLISNFSKTFYNCSSLRGNTPKDQYGELWERQGQSGLPSYIQRTDCFYGCTGLTNYNDIPTAWR